jgi:hypothetical protein
LPEFRSLADKNCKKNAAILNCGILNCGNFKLHTYLHPKRQNGRQNGVRYCKGDNLPRDKSKNDNLVGRRHVARQFGMFKKNGKLSHDKLSHDKLSHGK